MSPEASYHLSLPGAAGRMLDTTSTCSCIQPSSPFRNTSVSETSTSVPLYSTPWAVTSTSLPMSPIKSPFCIGPLSWGVLQYLGRFVSKPGALRPGAHHDLHGLFVPAARPVHTGVVVRVFRNGRP